MNFLFSSLAKNKNSISRGGLEYLHHSPASCRRQQKGNPVPGVITGQLSVGGHKYKDLVPQVVG
jgi:hypothetical protein